jgi:predicted amidohydrolase YtcJ
VRLPPRWQPLRGDERADRVILNARVQTLEGSSGPQHEAVAIGAGGRVLATGSNREIQALGGAGTEELDAGGATVLPAFTDSHTHFKRASVLLEYFINFDEVLPASVADVVDVVRKKAGQQPVGAWVQGDSLNPMHLAENRFPTRWELDEASTEHPVVLRSVGRHVVSANSLALRLAGIEHGTSDPQGGRIDRDAAGNPTGVLHEQAQLRLDANSADTVIPKVTADQRLTALSRGVSLLNQHGITAIHEMPREPEQIEDWLILREREDPRVRVRFYVRGLKAQTKLDDLLGLGLRGGFGDEWIRIGGVKISVDGSALFRNAMVYEPYPGTSDNLGLQRVDDDELVDAVRRAHRAGFQLAIHAIGQRAVDVALGAFRTLRTDGDEPRGRRHRIEHAYLPERGPQLEQMRDLGLIYSTQASFVEAEGDTWCDIFADEELDGVMPLARALELGVHVQLNSDFPCSPLDPLLGVQAAVTRRTRGGRQLDPRQAVSARTGMRLMTDAPAYTAFEEGWRGRLERGYVADLMLMDRDPTQVAADEITSVRVVHTMVGGRTVHQV